MVERTKRKNRMSLFMVKFMFFVLGLCLLCGIEDRIRGVMMIERQYGTSGGIFLSRSLFWFQKPEQTMSFVNKY